MTRIALSKHSLIVRDLRLRHRICSRAQGCEQQTLFWRIALCVRPTDRVHIAILRNGIGFGFIFQYIIKRLKNRKSKAITIGMQSLFTLHTENTHKSNSNIQKKEMGETDNRMICCTSYTRPIDSYILYKWLKLFAQNHMKSDMYFHSSLVFCD